MEMTFSPSPMVMPRTPVESRPLKTRTSPTSKRIARPPEVVSSTSSLAEQVATSTMPSPSSSFMAILPLRLISTKSASELRRTVPRVVENMMSSFCQSASSSGSGMIDVMRSPVSRGKRLISALPRPCGSATGRRHTLSL